MKTLTVIGVSTEGGFGNYMADQLADEYTVNRHGRKDKDADWKVDADIIVLNLFDRERPLLQTLEFDRLFKMVKNTNTLLVAIGSTIHYVNKQSGYASGKCALKSLFHGLGFNTGEYQCKLLLVEPGSLDNRFGQPDVNYHLRQEELVRVLRAALMLEQKFMHIIVRGGHAPRAATE